MSEVKKYYKGFNPGLTCKGRQYKEGEWDHVSDKAILCKEGVHACEAPLDVFRYYPPATSEYHEVELKGVSSKRYDNTKFVATDIKVGAKLDIRGLVNAQIEFVKSRTTMEHADQKLATAGDYGAATAGYSGAATAGDYGAATAGYSGAATAGYGGAATAGDYGAATAGDYGAATSRGIVSVGEKGCGLVRGKNVKIKGGLGAILVIAEENTNNFDIRCWKSVVVDGSDIKADTWYRLKNGEFEEVEDEDR